MIAPATSPSGRNLIIAPVARIASTRWVCRGRSSTATVRSSGPAAQRLGNLGDHVANRGLRIDGVRRRRRHHGLAHVEARTRVEHLPALGEGDHADRVRQHLGGQRRPVHRVDRDVHLRTGTVADLLAVVQHRARRPSRPRRSPRRRASPPCRAPGASRRPRRRPPGSCRRDRDSAPRPSPRPRWPGSAQRPGCDPAPASGCRSVWARLWSSMFLTHGDGMGADSPVHGARPRRAAAGGWMGAVDEMSENSIIPNPHLTASSQSIPIMAQCPSGRDRTHRSRPITTPIVRHCRTGPVTLHGLGPPGAR